MMEHQAFAMTHVGRRRPQNEDAFRSDASLGLHVVCDGLGSLGSGDVASQLACEAIHTFIRANQSICQNYASDQATPAHRAQGHRLPAEAIAYASKAVFNAAQANPAYAGMATTAAVLLMMGGDAVMAHAGDSRIYLRRGGRFHLLTEDHTDANDSFDRPLFGSKPKNGDEDAKITRVVGAHDTVEADNLAFGAAPGDLYLLCSDGLSRYADAKRMQSLCSDIPAKDLPMHLVQFANAQGGQDNITVIAVEVPAYRIGQTQAPVGGAGHSAGNAGGGSRNGDAIHKMDALRRTRLFSNLNYREVMLMTSLAQVEAYPAGSRIIRQTDAASDLYVSVRGQFDVVQSGQLLARLNTGAFFGEMAMIDMRPASADVIAVTDARVLRIPRQELMVLMRQEPKLANKLMWTFCSSLVRRLRVTSQTLTMVRNSIQAEQRAVATAIAVRAADQSEDDGAPAASTESSGAANEAAASANREPASADADTGDAPATQTPALQNA